MLYSMLKFYLVLGDDEMTEKQRRFVDEYVLTGGNATESARRAGYSSKTAYSIGGRLLKNVEVCAAIDERIKAASDETTKTQADLLKFLSEIVDGKICDEQLMTRLVGKGCSEIERREVRTSVKDRSRACELLLKVAGAFREKENQQSTFADLYVADLEKVWANDEASTG